MKRKIIQQIEFSLSGMNLWWDTKIEQHFRFIISVIITTFIVFGITGENVKIRVLSLMFTGVFCLVRIYGSIINQRIDKAPKLVK